ncbi:MAG: histidine phosphatase family protein [Myxococcales bacterium]|nr:histidine phosphatase family protein [Myxococcales bacterium]
MVLIRHGRTAWNVEGRFLGRSDVGLDEVGWQQAASLQPLADHFGRVFSSPARRAVQTAAALGREPVLLDGVQEVDQGDLEGLCYPEALARWPDFFAAWAADPAHSRIPGGETLSEARDRMVATLEALPEAPDGRPVAVVTHQLVTAALLCTLRGRDLTDWRSHRLDHVARVRLVRSGSGWAEDVGEAGPTV